MAILRFPALAVFCMLPNLLGARFQSRLGVLLLGSSLLGPPADAKVHTGTVRLGGVRQQNSWSYATKFGYGLGVGRFKIRVKLKRPAQLMQDGHVTVEMHLDEQWPEAEAQQDHCQRKASAKDNRTLTVQQNGDWSDWQTGTIRHNVRPHIWYFALSECNGSMPSSTHYLSFEFHGTQEDGSEFSAELCYMRLVNTLHILAFTVFLWICFNGTLAYFRSTGAIHPVIWTLSVELCMQYVAYLLHTAHLWVYNYNGYGVWAFDFVSEVLLMVTQVLVSSLLIMIALGYTLLHSTLRDLEVLIPILGMITILHLMLVTIGKFWRDDASDKNHENEGVIGWSLFVLRLVLYIWFLFAVRSTAATGGMRLDAFLRKFRFAGSAFFLSYPVIFLITQLVAPYWQHCILASGLMAMNMCSNIWLANIFLKRGDYFKVSTLNCSALPGATGKGE